MNKDDQTRLLEHNTPLYLQFRLGSFLAENHVKEEPSASLTMPSSNFINFRNLETQLGLFRPGTNLDEYETLINGLRCLKTSRSMEESAIITYVILFNLDETLQLTEMGGFEDIRLMNEIMFDSYITSTDTNFEIRDLVATLSKMGLFCTYNIDWDQLVSECGGGISIANVVMTFTAEEEVWIDHQMNLVDATFR